jgi:uncharacterized protein (TIGR02246 family)
MTRSDADEAARDLYRRMLDAWNARDADGYGALFAPDATVIGFDGSQVDGAHTAEHVGSVFADHATAAYVAKVREVRSLAPDVVLLRAIVGMVPPGQDALNPKTNAVQTVLAAQRDGAWHIALLQNTPAQYHGRPEATEEHTAELQPLVADGVTVG